MSKRLFALTIFAVVFSTFGFSQQFTTFSFASDDTHDGPVFKFHSGTAIEAKTEVDLMVDVNDDNNGGQITFQSLFRFRGEAYDYMVVPCGSNWLHVWKVKGEGNFTHIDPTMANTLLKFGFEQATLTSISPSQSVLGQTLTLQVFDRVDPSFGLSPDTILVGAGVDPFELVERKDLAFTFTKANFGKFVKLNEGRWGDEFTTESSFSASGSEN